MASVKIGPTDVVAFEGAGLDPATFKTQSDAFGTKLKASLVTAGYPEKANPDQMGGRKFRVN